MNPRKITIDWATHVATVCVCFVALASQGEVPNLGKGFGVRLDPFEDGRDVAVSGAGRSMSASAQPGALCVTLSQGVLISSACTQEEASARGFSSPNEVRRALGLLPCWWHAKVDEIQSIRGVNWSYAALAIKLRNEHWPMGLAQIEIREELGSRGPKIASSFTEDCALWVD